MGGAWKWCTRHLPHPELSHPATFTARMAGSVVQLCPGSWETMFGDQLASLCLASAQRSSRGALPALDEAELTFCANEPGVGCYPGSSSFLQVSPLLFPASLILSDALAESWLLRLPSHVFRQHIFIEHLLCARAVPQQGTPAPASPNPASHARFPALLLSCDLRSGSQQVLPADLGPLPPDWAPTERWRCPPPRPTDYLLALEQMQLFTHSCLSLCPFVMNQLLHREGFCRVHQLSFPFLPPGFLIPRLAHTHPDQA